MESRRFPVEPARPERTAVLRVRAQQAKCLRWHDDRAAGGCDHGAMIAIDELSKHDGAHTAVDGPSFDVRPGIVTGSLGPNGAGKSTPCG
jgi:ABC-type polysaccharide/polyol phosphate transport system ATPase subunit